VGAGQIYRATESQKIAALSDREATEIVRGRRASNVVPIAIFAVVVVAGTLGAWAYTRRDLQPHATTGSVGASTPSPERAALDDAKALCASGDCDGAHKKIQAAVAESSPLRSSQDYKDIETKWADQTLARADAQTDTTAKQALYQSVAQDMSADPSRRKTAADKLQQLEALADALPVAAAAPPASTKSHGDDATPAPARPEPAHHQAAVAVAVEPPAPAPAPAAPTVQTVAAKGPATSVDDRERALALQGTQDSKALLKKQLEQRMNNGKASDTEIRLLIGTCKDLGDRACVQAARAALAQKQE
jgi:hypothetical protein